MCAQVLAINEGNVICISNDKTELVEFKFFKRIIMFYSKQLLVETLNHLLLKILFYLSHSFIKIMLIIDLQQNLY